MRVTKEKAAENRARILNAASRLFREHGVSGVGVDALTGAAGMTHGSLYSQFGSKERLADEALAHALRASSARMGDAKTLEDYVARYLAPEHCEGRADGCAIAALAGEMPRHHGAIRGRFTLAIRAFSKRLQDLMPARHDAEDRALASVATMVGALTLARAVDDEALAEQLLAAARRQITSG